MSYENRYTEAGDIDDFHAIARIGIAPYIGNYGDLHMVDAETDHTPEGKHSTTVTPLVRFLKTYIWLKWG